MDKLYENSETGCCPRFNPQPWDKKEVTFKDKLFIKDHVTSFLHIPLNFGKVMVRNMESIAKAGALAPEPILLSDEKFALGCGYLYRCGQRRAGGGNGKNFGNIFNTGF